MKWQLTILAIFAGGGLGSLLRYGVSRLVIAAGFAHRFPLGTLLVNVLACALMAAALSWGSRYRPWSEIWQLFWLVGVCGGFSTFSTFSYENWLLLRSGQYFWLGLNVGLSVLLCLGVFIWASRYFNS